MAFVSVVHDDGDIPSDSPTDCEKREVRLYVFSPSLYGYSCRYAFSPLSWERQLSEFVFFELGFLYGVMFGRHYTYAYGTEQFHHNISLNGAGVRGVNDSPARVTPRSLTPKAEVTPPWWE